MPELGKTKRRCDPGAWERFDLIGRYGARLAGYVVTPHAYSTGWADSR
jgi:hypothetical protein